MCECYRLCSQCSDGYFGLIDNCYKCSQTAGLIAAIVGLMVAWYILNVVISFNMPSLEMLLSWAQLANVIGEVNLQWPPALNKVFGIANILDFDVDILEPSCLIPSWSYRWNFVVQLLLPVFMASLAFIGYAFSRMMYSVSMRLSEMYQNKLQHLWMIFNIPENRDQLIQMWDATLAKSLSSFEVTYVTIAKYCFDALKCQKIGVVNVLAASSDIKCGSQSHNTLVALGIFGIAFYSAGYLAFVSWKLWDMYNRRSFADPKNLRQYGFLYTRFELEYFWTGIVVLIRRLAFVAVLVFVNNPAFQAGALAAITVASLMLHIYTTPYADTYLDVLFSFLMVALMFEAFGGLMFYSENLPSENRRILEWIVLMALVILAVVFFFIFCMELVHLFERQIVKKMHLNAILPKSVMWRGRPQVTFSLSNVSRTSQNKISKHEVTGGYLN